MIIPRPYVIRVSERNVQLSSPHDTNKGPLHVSQQKPGKLMGWKGNERLPDPYPTPHYDRIVADHIPGTDCFVERLSLLVPNGTAETAVNLAMEIVSDGGSRSLRTYRRLLNRAGVKISVDNSRLLLDAAIEHSERRPNPCRRRA